MRISLLIILVMIVPCTSFGQDERFFRKLFSGEFMREKKIVEEKHYSNIFHTPEYLIDLTSDGVKESIVYVKRDSEDWIDVLNSNHEKIYSYRFEVKGINSALYRVIKKQLDSETTILVLYFYEGETKYINYESSARIYLLTVDKHDLSKISVYKGPSFFEEHESFKSHYHIKNYKSALVDLNGDKQRELIVTTHGMSQVFIYNGNGNWQTFKN